MTDIEDQVSFVVSSVERLLSQIDGDILSPTYGCAHLAYWRDKTSDVADTRRQEAMLPLALLFARRFPGSPFQGDVRLQRAVGALLTFWMRGQYTDGSHDEWYKGERAYAAAAFSAHAVARTLDVMREHLPRELLARAEASLARTAGWLMRRDDLFKTNHQAVGACALAWAGHTLKEPRYTNAAKEKLASIVRTQTSEGWFPEVGHMDVGYTFLTVEFAAMAMEVMDDHSLSDPFARAFDFATEWVHPDTTVGEEYGVCHNPYVSRIAVILMSRFSGRARRLRRMLDAGPVGFKGLRSTLADDLRLPRWAFQPLLAHEYSGRFPLPAEAPDEALPLARTDADSRVYALANLARFAVQGRPLVVAACAGGLTRFFGEEGRVLSDHGYAVETEDGYATNLTYDRAIQADDLGREYAVLAPLSPVRKFMPPFWARIALRVACSTAAGSRLARRCIDVVRKRKGTAINQSSANLKSSSRWALARSVRREDDRVILADTLRFDRPVRSDRISFLTANEDGVMTLTPVAVHLPGLSKTLTELTITKTYVPGPSWKLAGIRP
ncbi:MAG: hypothetical protein HY748_11160 [Elusimicrobia bacterium]|nr:hypothetical protein [Elusimicrobiota bacterium]